MAIRVTSIDAPWLAISRISVPSFYKDFQTDIINNSISTRGLQHSRTQCCAWGEGTLSWLGAGWWWDGGGGCGWGTPCLGQGNRGGGYPGQGYPHSGWGYTSGRTWDRTLDRTTDRTRGTLRKDFGPETRVPPRKDQVPVTMAYLPPC